MSQPMVNPLCSTRSVRTSILSASFHDSTTNPSWAKNAKLAEGVAAAPIDVVVDHLAAGHKTLWH